MGLSPVAETPDIGLNIGMSKAEEKQQLFDHWNSKKIIVHTRLSHDMNLEIARALKYYSLEELIGLIDFYATILEPGVPDHEKRYFWTYRWNLWEFLKRGVKKFDGQELKDYQRRQTVSEGVTIKRK